MSTTEGIKGLFKATADAYSDPVGVLVNNAGITRDTLVLRMKSSQWEDVINTNLNGVFYASQASNVSHSSNASRFTHLATRRVSQAAAKIMLKKRAGRIINIASVVGKIGNAGQANYAAAKVSPPLAPGGCALAPPPPPQPVPPGRRHRDDHVDGARVRAARRDGQLDRPRIHRVRYDEGATGEYRRVGTSTTRRRRHNYAAINNTAQPPSQQRQVMGTIPCGRFGKPEEVAGLVKYLALDDSALYITGHTINIDGGIAIGTC